MHKTLKMLFSSALLVAALLSFSAFTSASPAGATAHATPAGFTGHAMMSPSYTCPLPVIQSGSSGAAVKLAQQSLNWWEENSTFQWSTDSGLLTVDSSFGPKTTKEVKQFQSWYTTEYGIYLKTDGIVGAKTWHALGHC